MSFDINLGSPLRDFAEFAGGFVNAWSSDNLLGAGRQEQSSFAGKLGAGFGDAAAIVQGLSEFGGGIGGEAGGLILDATGVGAVAGVPINIASAGLILHGGATVLAGAGHLAMTDLGSGGGGVSEPSSAGSQPSPRIPGASDEEHAIDEYLRAKGEQVEKNPLEGTEGAGRQPDRIVDGVPTEYKSLSGVGDTSADSLSGAEASRIMDARGQSSNIIIDARGQPGMTQEIAERGIARAYGADNKTGGTIQSIRVIGNGFDITVPRR